MSVSMTGYSRVTATSAAGTVTVELRSTNHRYLEVDQRLPDGLAVYESEVVQLLRQRLRRGRIDVSVAVQGAGGRGAQVELDAPLAQTYYRKLSELRARLRLTEPVTLAHVLSLPKVLTLRDGQDRAQVLWPAIRRALLAAVSKLIVARRQEGRRLIHDIRAQAEVIRARMRVIRAALPKNARLQQQRLYERLKAIVGSSASLTPSQMQQALSVVKGADVHEELVRLDSHLVHLRQALSGSQAMGKALDFIAQELTRETNTLGAKAEDAFIAREVIQIKSAIEKIREQAQNLE
ncbi:MAG: YicC family protein [Candidatus Omnitrophica bacterium]|nr:YicC family protein [Candidatus Omnitrophota bacterium]